MKLSSKDGGKVMTVIASPGQGPDRSTEVSYTDTKVIGNGSFGVVYQAKLCESGEMVAIKKVLQDKRFKNRELQIMRRLEHCNIVKLMYFFYTSGEKKDEITSTLSWSSSLRRYTRWLVSMPRVSSPFLDYLFDCTCTNCFEALPTFILKASVIATSSPKTFC